MAIVALLPCSFFCTLSTLVFSFCFLFPTLRLEDDYIWNCRGFCLFSAATASKTVSNEKLAESVLLSGQRSFASTTAIILLLHHCLLFRHYRFLAIRGNLPCSVPLYYTKTTTGTRLQDNGGRLGRPALPRCQLLDLTADCPTLCLSHLLAIFLFSAWLWLISLKGLPPLATASKRMDVASYCLMAASYYYYSTTLETAKIIMVLPLLGFFSSASQFEM